MKQHKVLIVGGTGYLGAHLSAYLAAQGYEVHNTGSKPLSIKDYYQVVFESADSFKNLPKTKFDFVIILAAKLNALGITNLDHQDLSSNTVAYAGFLEFLHQNKLADKIIYTSSMTVYSENNPLPVTETGVIKPVNTYGLSKYLAENITSFFCERNGVPGVIFRLPGVYGGNRESGFIYNAIKKIKNNESLKINTRGLIYWETIYIDHLCEFIDLFIRNYHWNLLMDIFNVCYGEETDIYNTAHFINEIFGNKQTILIEEEKGYRPFYLSNNKLKKIIPIERNFHDGLKEYINHLRA